MLQLKVIRERLGKSLRELSKESGIALATLVRLEATSFDPRLSTLRKLAKALGVPISELIDEGSRLGKFNIYDRRRNQMAGKDNQKERDAAATEAVKALEDWRRTFFVKRVGPLVWDYEYDQVQQAMKLLQTLLTNLKGKDSRDYEY